MGFTVIENLDWISSTRFDILQVIQKASPAIYIYICYKNKVFLRRQMYCFNLFFISTLTECRNQIQEKLTVILNHRSVKGKAHESN